MSDDRSVTARIKCFTDELGFNDTHRLQFVPDYEDKRNQSWAYYTPALFLDMTVRNEVAEGFFANGAKYELVFRKLEDPPPTNTEVAEAAAEGHPERYEGD